MKTNQTISSFGRVEIQVASDLALRTSRVILILLLVMQVSNYELLAQLPNWNNLQRCSKAEWEINDAQYDNNLLVDKEDWGEQVIQVSDGGYVVAGFSHDPGGSYIAKFNANGNKAWCYRTTTDPGGAFIDVTETDNYYVAVGYSGILRINKDGTSPEFMLVATNQGADFSSVIKTPDGVVITGGFRYTDINSISREGLLVFSIPLANIDDGNSPLNLYPSNTLFNWMTVIGKDYLNVANNVSLPSSQHTTSDPWPLIPYNSVAVSTNQAYTDFGGSWACIETNGSGYNVYVTGHARWGGNMFNCSHDITNVPWKDGSLQTVAMSKLTINPSDVLASKIIAPTSNPLSNVNTAWTKTYNQVPVAASTIAADPYMRYFSPMSPRRTANITAGVPTPLQEVEAYFFNNLQNSGTYIDVCKANTNKLMIGAAYNLYGVPWQMDIITYGGGDYRDADAGTFVIDKANGSLQSTQPKLLAHNSGDDFKIRMTQNKLGEFFTVGTTADENPPYLTREYKFVNNDPTKPIKESFLTAKFILDNVNNDASIKWIRDFYSTGTLDYSGVNVNEPMGICGFGIFSTWDNGYVMCGNNNQQTLDGNGLPSGHSDDITIVKMSPDCEINAQFDAGFVPFNAPIEYTGIASINFSKTIGRHMVVKNGGDLTIQNCTLQFTNSQWLYDFPALLFNAPTMNPRIGGMIGITVEKGGKLTLINCTLKGMTNDCSNENRVGNMWDGIVVEGAPSAFQNVANQGTLVMNNATIENAFIAVTLDGRAYSMQESPNLYSYKIGYCPLYSDVGSIQLGRAYFKRPSNNSFKGKGGGKITATNSHFVNNSRKHVEFMKYDGYANNSSFINCDFTTTNHSPELITIDDDGDWVGTQEYCSIWANHGIRFYGCRFDGYTVNHVDPLNGIAQPQIYKNGKGIISLNAEFTVTGFCADNPPPIFADDPCTNYIRSHFKNLQIGISAAPSLGMPSTKYLNINNSEFGMLSDGVTLDLAPNLENIFVNGGGKNVQIHHNYINVADKDVSDPSQWGNPHFYPFGIHLQGTDGFMVEENTIIGGNNQNVLRHNDYGIVINDAGARNNRVYLNNVSNLEHALVSLHMNWIHTMMDPDICTGLDWVCNSLNISPTFGIEVMSASNIRSYNTAYINNQPNYVIVPNSCHNPFQGSATFPVNNTFNYPCSGTTKLERDAASNIFFYSYDTPPTNPNPCIQAGIGPIAATSNTNTCESHFNIGPIKSKVKELDYVQLLQNIVSEEFIANTILEMAGSNSIIEFINNPSISNTILRDYLINAGPYLTDEIIEAVINRPNAPLTNAQLSEIILANSPISDDNYDELEDERPIIAGNGTIIAAQYSEFSPRQKLKVSLANIRANKRNLCITASNYYMNLEEPNPALVANLFLTSGLALDAVPYLIITNNYSSANTLLSNYAPSNIEEQDVKTYLQMMLAMAENNTQINDVVIGNLQNLEAIATHHTATAYAVKNLLAQYNNAPFPTATKPLMGEGGANKTIKQKRTYNITNNLIFADENSAILFPNPAYNNVILKTRLVETAQKLMIEIYTLVGQKVKVIEMKAQSGNVDINIDGLSVGNYLVKVSVDGEPLLNNKLAVIAQ